MLTINDISKYSFRSDGEPPHLGELIRESMEDVGWSVAETATQLGCEQGTSYRTRHLNGKAGGSVNIASALERIGWGTADHWMRVQA